MRPKVVLTLLLTALAVLGLAQTSPAKITIAFIGNGEREVWVATGLPTDPPADSIRTGSNQVEVPVAGKPDSDAIFVWDKGTGNLASMTVGQAKKEGTWSLVPEKFQDIALVKVRVESGGKPAAAAQVILKDPRREISQLLDPNMNGEVTFFAVKPGRLTVTVKYRSGGTMAKPVTQILDTPMSRAEAVPTFAIALPSTAAAIQPPAGATPTTIPDKPAGEAAAATGAAAKGAAPGTAATGAAPTADQGASGKSGPPATVPGTEPANPLGTFVVILIGLALAGAAGYFALRYTKQNPELVQSKLEQLGVQVPKPGDDQPLDPSVAPTPAPVKPAPPQKIILGDAAPDPIAAAPASTGLSEPRLVAEAGDAMTLSDGETVVGREVGLGLSLVGETSVSRRHAALVRNGGSVIVKDLGSTNGTYVNGAKVQGDTPLRSGDTVQFGAVRFRYEG